MSLNRRDWLGLSAASLISTGIGTRLEAQTGDTNSVQVDVDLPRARVPMSFIIDDSTCLVNMGKYCMPQFAATYPDRASYQKPWRDWPDEIPDSFVRQFGSWCAEQGVKGKYSVVPYPACVGWLDRELPGWSRQALKASLNLVRDLMLPNWDIHPEMITHTRVIDIKTGRPFADYSPAHMENSYPQEDVSVDYLASYLAYALRILKNCDLPCEGITTPGGFGNRVKDKLPLAVFQAVRDVYGTELPHYFKYIADLEDGTEPKMEAVRGESGLHPECTANVLAGTGDWFGGWDGALESQGFKYASEDATSGRMVELIQRKQPAVMLCHWPGLYCNGSQAGFRDFQQVVIALQKRFGNETQWMKISEIGRYWAAKRFTQVSAGSNQIALVAPYKCNEFTLKTTSQSFAKAVHSHGDSTSELKPVSTLASLAAGTWYREGEHTWFCFDLLQGENRIIFTP